MTRMDVRCGIKLLKIASFGLFEPFFNSSEQGKKKKAKRRKMLRLSRRKHGMYFSTAVPKQKYHHGKCIRLYTLRVLYVYLFIYMRACMFTYKLAQLIYSVVYLYACVHIYLSICVQN